jgi:pimeloyl-ACP methyl ester carboxylesterase
MADLIKDGLFEPPVMVPTVIGDITRIGVDRCLEQLGYMSEHDLDGALLRCGIPILLIKGENDKLSSEDLVQEKFEMIPNCQAINVIGSAHCLSVSDPELMAKMIEDFIQQGDLNDVYRAA